MQNQYHLSVPVNLHHMIKKTLMYSSYMMQTQSEIIVEKIVQNLSNGSFILNLNKKKLKKIKRQWKLEFERIIEMEREIEDWDYFTWL